MTYVPGPPSPRSDAVWREFYRIAREMTDGAISDRGLIYVGDYNGDDYTKIQKALDDANCYQTVLFEPNKVYELTAELAIAEQPLKIDMNGSWLMSASGYTGYLLSINGCRRGVPNSYMHHPCLQDQFDWFLEGFPNLSGPRVQNGFFSGYGRQRPCGGIIFRGGNSDANLYDLYFYDIPGTAIAACDPNSNEGLDADNQYLQECTFRDIFIQNCGETDQPSFLIGRNANGLSNHNNLRCERMSVFYSRRSEAIRILNNNPATNNGRIQEVQFENLFVHGNHSIFERAGSPEYSDPYAEHDLIKIGEDGNVGTEKRIRRIYMTGCRVIEQETGYAGINVRQDTDLQFNGYYVSSGVDRPGFKLSDAGAVSIENDGGFDLEDHIVIDGEFRYLGHQLRVGINNHISPASYDGPNIDLGPSSWERVMDSTEYYVTYRYPGDTALGLTGTDNFSLIIIGDSRNIDVLNDAWIMPESDLAEGSANFAKIYLRFYNEDGSIRNDDNILTTTRTVALEGTGSWTARNRVPIVVPEGHLVPSAIGFEIQKVGASGAVLPPFIIQLRMSQTLMEKKS